MTETRESDYVTIARIRKPWGKRGEIAVEIQTQFPERFQAGERMLVSAGGRRQELTIESVWFHKGQAIVKFRGFDTISAAEALASGKIQIPLSQRRKLAPGEVYLSDLVGCFVLEDGSVLGQVEAVEETGAAPLLQVPTAEGELLIPFAEEICTTIDLEKREIRVRLPEGLKELNRKR